MKLCALNLISTANWGVTIHYFYDFNALIPVYFYDFNALIPD